jgi:hypothetical protein
LPLLECCEVRGRKPVALSLHPATDDYVGDVVRSDVPHQRPGANAQYLCRICGFKQDFGLRHDTHNSRKLLFPLPQVNLTFSLIGYLPYPPQTAAPSAQDVVMKFLRCLEPFTARAQMREGLMECRLAKLPP